MTAYNVAMTKRRWVALGLALGAGLRLYEIVVSEDWAELRWFIGLTVAVAVFGAIIALDARRRL